MPTKTDWSNVNFEITQDFANEGGFSGNDDTANFAARVGHPEWPLNDSHDHGQALTSSSGNAWRMTHKIIEDPKGRGQLRHREASIQHSHAAMLHRQAAEAASKSGDDDKAFHHFIQSERHSDFAVHHHKKGYPNGWEATRMAAPKKKAACA
jgi:hypothetical protein